MDTTRSAAPRRPRPVAIALVEAFDRSMSRDDLQDLDDDELRRFSAVVFHWRELAAREKDRRVHK